MKREVPIEFDDDREYQEEERWTCYDSVFKHALHGQTASSWQIDLVYRYLKDGRLIDKSYLAYFNLLGVIDSKYTIEELVAQAEENWIKRKTNRYFAEGESWHGYGEYNDYYLDIFLAAVLEKINWKGESIHRWRW